MVKTSPIKRLLMEMLKKNEIPDAHTPRQVRAMRSEFQKVKESTFRGYLSEVRNVLKDNPEVDEKDDGLNPICTVPDTTKRQKTEHVDIVDLDESDFEEGDDLVSDTREFFKPVHIVAEWEDADTDDKRVTLAIWLPSGVGQSRKDHEVSVTGDGKFLKLSVVWPVELTNMNLLHKAWPDKEEPTSSNLIARMMSFKPFFARSASPFRIRSTYKFKLPFIVIRSTYKFKLPFIVKTDVTLRKTSTFYLGWKASLTRILYVTLEAPDDKYGVAEDEVPMFTEA